jgi:hypothetical protein
MSRSAWRMPTRGFQRSSRRVFAMPGDAVLHVLVAAAVVAVRGGALDAHLAAVLRYSGNSSASLTIISASARTEKLLRGLPML